jgi:hypothetical protein
MALRLNRVGTERNQLPVCQTLVAAYREVYPVFTASRVLRLPIGTVSWCLSLRDDLASRLAAVIPRGGIPEVRFGA